MKACIQCQYRMEDYEGKCPRCGGDQQVSPPTPNPQFLVDKVQNAPYNPSPTHLHLDTKANPVLQNDPVLNALDPKANPSSFSNDSNANYGLWGSIGLLAALVSVGWFIFRPPGKPGEAEAYNAAVNAIRTRLNAPATANFPGISDRGVTVVKSGDNFSVSSYVDAQNTYGAKLREKWNARVHASDDGRSMVVDSATLEEERA